MSWICPKCETENPDRLKVCEVCDSPRKASPLDRLKKKYHDAEYEYFIRYHSDLLESADKGNKNAQYQIGKWFYKRKSSNKSIDYNRISVLWYRIAAMKGHAEAQYALASCYENGCGVSQRKDEALKWYKAASNRGHGMALDKYLSLKYNNKTYNIVIRFKKDLLSAADNGHRGSQYLLGEWFRKYNNQSAYKEEAIVWYTKAAKQGHGEAMQKLGYCYEHGIGVNIDINESLKWYKKAAKSGNNTACLKLAESYMYGGMLEKNVEEAAKWYELLGEDVSETVWNKLGYAYYVGDSVFTDKVKAVEYYRKAAKRGYAIAQYNLGICYENGEGVVKNIDFAKKWYQKAAQQGYTLAQQSLSRLSENCDTGCGAFLTSLIVGPIWGVTVYKVIESLPEVLSHCGINIQLPDIWLNNYPGNIITCIVLGIIVVFLYED